MKVLSLIGKQLKDDEILELLESEDVSVVYDFDRSHENMPDIYWAAFKQAGFLLRFDEDQRLDTIFFYIVPDEGSEAVVPGFLEDVPLFSSREQVERFAESCQGEFFKGEPGPSVRWAKFNKGEVAFHYEFHDDVLHRVTLSLIK